MGKGPTREQSVHDATNAYVRELTGGGVVFLPSRSAAAIARQAFKRNAAAGAAAAEGADLQLDVATGMLINVNI